VSRRVLQITIPTPQGFLEGILKPEQEGSQPEYMGIVCHLHPRHGGTMHNKVVFSVAQTLQTLNIPALRFNFRGVGQSTGSYDGGRGEMDDVRYALDFLSHRYPGVPALLGGFSFGAYVGLRVAAHDDRVQAMIGIGVPAGWFHEEILQGCSKPKLLIHGTADELAPFDLTVQWFEQLPAPKRLAVVEGADHFFQNHLDDVQTIISGFVRSL
jgi:alpha/beta superfamily hydrolase